LTPNKWKYGKLFDREPIATNYSTPQDGHMSVKKYLCSEDTMPVFNSIVDKHSYVKRSAVSLLMSGGTITDHNHKADDPEILKKLGIPVQDRSNQAMCCYVLDFNGDKSYFKAGSNTDTLDKCEYTESKKFKEGELLVWPYENSHEATIHSDDSDRLALLFNIEL
jgi:hypothetical protein